ncbi:xyloglucan endotransglucosylase/hydrolase 1-like [Arachis ipaensis]|uniref:xyloglucan endotransglucosylase/hydrolase 1-like n=1 Tax=Arachis ipaensis TaxID=130454 RepID=UPI000A2B6421|nr:xyloglucan endotransglucosylase/hydrolase 1-like [Arachis ipaensis]
MGYYSLWSVCCVILAWFVSVGICGTPRSPMAVPFGRNYVPTWAYDHIKYLNSGYDAQLLLDKYTGTGFNPKVRTCLVTSAWI